MRGRLGSIRNGRADGTLPDGGYRVPRHGRNIYCRRETASRRWPFTGWNFGRDCFLVILKWCHVSAIHFYYYYYVLLDVIVCRGHEVEKLKVWKRARSARRVTIRLLWANSTNPMALRALLKVHCGSPIAKITDCAWCINTIAFITPYARKCKKKYSMLKSAHTREL